MSNQDNDSDFQEFKRMYRKGTAGRGECPSSDDLVRYHENVLSAEEELRISQHVKTCGLCDLAVTQLSEFESAEIKVAVKKPSLLRLFLHPAFAYALVLVLLYPAYRGIFVTEERGQRIGSAKDFDLGEGSQKRTASNNAEIREVRVLPGEEFFILNFYVPVRGDHLYEMEIANAEGRILESQEIKSRDALGNFSIVCYSSVFPDGRYVLTVKEKEIRTKEMKDEYQFLFHILH